MYSDGIRLFTHLCPCHVLSLEVLSRLKAFATMLRECQTNEDIYPGKSWWLVKENARYQDTIMISEQVGLSATVFSTYLGRKMEVQLQLNTGSMFFVRKFGGVNFVTVTPKGTMSELDMEASVTPAREVKEVKDEPCATAA